METLSPSQPLSENHGAHMSQPAPENADSSSHPSAAGSKSHLLYKCLLNQLVQKLKKPSPVYQTQNEGSDHLPRFRSTVWVDGLSYTSSSTFQQRKMSEMDVSKLAYISIIQKAKTDALHFIQEDKISCKAIMAEFAAKKNIGTPVYETTQLEAPLPLFRSNMLLNGGTYVGDIGKTKKEAEQLVARSVIIRYLNSESGNDMAFVVICKLRQFHEMNKVQEINSVQNGSSVLNEAGTSIMAESSAAPELSLAQGTMVPDTFPSSGVPQPIIPQLSVEPIAPVAPIVIQPPGQVSTEPVNPIVPVATQLPASQVSVELIKPAVAEPQVTQQPKPQASVEPIKPAVAEPLVLTPVLSAVVNNSCSPVVSAPLVDIPATNLSSNVIQQPNPEASPDQALEYIPLMGQTSDKKRSRNSRKNARKKMRAAAHIPVVPANQVLPFLSPQ
ncbi:hypothetical protein L1987_66218 [Smallanthus sonchifolius]|uniref:Uncharacterized protein n=1 Tax=Smallanthus sonchifolius TaxID=185202 RepID=A0ACB9BWH0_9ASTR|nr:hypothetical protein L1987_66218 [Smallanthus sonchifolius]